MPVPYIRGTGPCAILNQFALYSPNLNFYTFIFSLLFAGYYSLKLAVCHNAAHNITENAPINSLHLTRRFPHC